MIPLELYLLVAAGLFVMGLYGVLALLGPGTTQRHGVRGDRVRGGGGGSVGGVGDDHLDLPQPRDGGGGRDQSAEMVDHAAIILAGEQISPATNGNVQ